MIRTSRFCLLVFGLALLVFIPDKFARGDDLYISAANYGRYYHYKETKEDSVASRFQFDISMGNFYIGAWYELTHFVTDYSAVTSDSISQIYFGWEDNGLTIHAGNFYQTFDRGLILNAFRDDDVRFNLLLKGLKLNGRYDHIDFDVFSATPGVWGITKPVLKGIRLKIKPLRMVRFGGAYVRMNEPDFGLGDTRTNMNEINARITNDYFDCYVEYAQRDGYYINIFPYELRNQKGDGTYANLSAYYSYFTGFFEYKNYKFLAYPDLNLNYNMPPAVNHQQRSLQSQFGSTGECGYNVGFIFSPNYHWGIELDYADAESRDSLGHFIIEKYFEIRGNYFRDNLFTISYDRLEHSEKNETTPKFEISYSLDDIHSVALTAYLIKYEPLGESVQNSGYIEKYLDFNFARSYNFSLSVGGSWSDQDMSNVSDPAPKRLGYIELNIKFHNHDLIIFNGGQRGGLVCSGGLCFNRPTFQGTRVTLLSRF